MITQTITPVTHDLGAFQVRRVLPSKARTMVGPFIFVDEFGPGQLDIGTGMDVRPHPHINLATVTWLFEGAIDHRDSLGTFATIRPGQVNLMTAGRGIVHSERSPEGEMAQGAVFWWMGLYRGLWRFASLPDLWNIVKACALGFLGVVLGLFFYNRFGSTPRAVLGFYPVALVGFLGENAARLAALSGGDDYVLAFTLPEEYLSALLAEGWPIHVVGRVMAGQGVTLVDASGQDITPQIRGYQHFQETP